MRKLLILPLLVASCFSAHSQLGELVGEVFLTYETCFTTVEIEGCTLGESYILQAEGLYTVWGGSCDKGDPAFDALDLGTPNPYSPWVWNDVCDGCQNNRPTPDVFNPDHVYQFPFVAQSETQSFHFQDTGGCSNNCGGIQFRIYRAASPASPNHVPNEGLAYWSSFNGVAEDESGNAISATAYGPHPTTDRHGNDGMALAFDGEDDYVLLYADEGGTSFGESLTLAAWVRPQASSLNGTHPRIFNSTEGVGGGPDRWLFTWSPPLHGEKMQFGVDPSTGAGPYGSTPLPVGQWSHVAMTFDQGEVQFYFNGEADGTATLATTSLAHVSAPIQIGSANGNSFFQGDIDEVGMWSRALSEAEIQALYVSVEVELPEHVPSEGLVAWYPFSGDVLDNSGQGLHLTQESAQFCPDRNGEQDAAMEFGATVDPLFSRLHFDGLLTDVADNFSMAFWGNPFESTNLPQQGQSGNENYPDQQMAWHPIHGQHFGPEDDHAGLGFGIGTNGIAFTEHSSAWTSAPLVVEEDLIGWHHYAVVVESGVPKLSIDGGPFVVGEASGRSLHLSLGIDPYYPDGGIGHGFQVLDDCAACNRYDGQLDDIGIWNRALTLEEIQGIALATPPGCGDPEACNYTPGASIDDGSCTYLPGPIDLGADIYTCDSVVELEAGVGFDAYLWSNGETTPSIEVTEIGDHVVQATLGSANQRAVQLHAPTILESSTDEVLNAVFAGLHPFSISLWVHADQLSNVELCDKGYSNSASGPNASSMQLFSGSDGLTFQVFSDANNWMGISTSSGTGLLEGEWNHVVCTYDGGTAEDALTLYVNGSDLDTISTPIQQGTFSGLHANAEPLHFGGRTSASGVNAYPLDGLLDDIFIFDHALSASQVEQLLTCGICLTPSCHWDFEETDAAIGDLINGTFASSGDCTSSLYSPSFAGNALLSPSAEVRSVHPQCLFTDSISVTLVPCSDLPSLCGEGTTWSAELHQCVEISQGCTPACGPGTVWDPVNEECIIAIPTDTDFDGCVSAGDVLNLLATFGTCPPIPFSGPCQGLDHVTYQEYDYSIVAIGDQCWFAENLRNNQFRDGEAISGELNGTEWASTDEAAQTIYGEGTNACFYGNCDPTVNLSNYGRLYNGHAVQDVRGLCPAGWHVPADSDWMALESHMGMSPDSLEETGWRPVALGSLKANPSNSPGWDGSNDYGFTGLPGGARNQTDGHFYNGDHSATFWGSDACLRSLGTNDDIERAVNVGPRIGASVRCIKD